MSGSQRQENSREVLWSGPEAHNESTTIGHGYNYEGMFGGSQNLQTVAGVVHGSVYINQPPWSVSGKKSDSDTSSRVSPWTSIPPASHTLIRAVTPL